MDCAVLVEEVVRVHPAAATTTAQRRTRSVETADERLVKFAAFNESYVVSLQPTSTLVSPHFAVVVRQGDADVGLADFTGDASRCLFRGRASKFANFNSTLPHRSATSDNAAFDLCRGMVFVRFPLIKRQYLSFITTTSSFDYITSNTSFEIVNLKWIDRWRRSNVIFLIS